MALNFSSSILNQQDTVKFSVRGDNAILRGNRDVFRIDGQLFARFPVGKEVQLFVITWPCLQAKFASTLSQWRLVICKASEDRIASFSHETAKKLGKNNWEVVKNVVEQCKEKFDALLLSMSSQEIVFIHSDEKMAERMKNSNEMVDIMNTLLADVENSFRDIVVDWKVTLKPVNVSLSYNPLCRDQAEDDDLENLNSLFLTDTATPTSGNSRNSMRASANIILTPQLQRLLDIVVAEQRRTQETVEKLAQESSTRHRFLCQKIAEVSNLLAHSKMEQEDGNAAQNDFESDYTQAEDNDFEGDEDEMMPSAKLFESGTGPFFEDQQQRQPGNFKTTADEATGRRQEPSCNNNREGTQFSQSAIFQEGPGSITDSSKPSETFKDQPLSGSDLENRNLDEAVERAYQFDDIPPPQAKSYNTILCLDISESMNDDGAYQQMINVVNKFIDGVENMVIETGVEENIGVVTFGGTANVVQNLTNDFARVRQAIEQIHVRGKSPFVEALLVAMAAFVRKAGIISVGGVYDVKPRIIFISDGHPTENIDDGGLDRACDKMHVRTSLTKVMMHFATKEKYSKVHPVVYIPVGRNPDKALMTSMATLSKGVYLEPDKVEQLCGYFMMQETIGKTLACMKGNQKSSKEDIAAIITGLMPNLTPEQKVEVIEKVDKERNDPSQKVRSSRGDLEDMFEDTDKVNAGEMLPLGTRVLRGPDWHWEDQDGYGPGTVFKHSKKGDWTYVAWDSGGHNRYAYGPDHGYDIFPTEDFPRLMQDDNDLHIGMTVEKGPDWQTNETSSQERLKDVQTGIVIRKSQREKKLMVRWTNGEIQVVRWGENNKYDVAFCNPLFIDQEPPLEYRTPDPENVFPVPNGPPSEPEFEDGRWQWKGSDGQWVDFDQDVSASIEKQYKRKRDGTCIIQRDNRSRRVMFKRMTEKLVDGGMETPVRRIRL